MDELASVRAIQLVAASLLRDDDGAVRIEHCIRVRDDARVEVVDQGIAPSDRDLVFEPFWRKDESTPGTGLGLAIARELMEMVLSRIEIRETPGGGANFVMGRRPHGSTPRRVIAGRLRSNWRTCGQYDHHLALRAP